MPNHVVRAEYAVRGAIPLRGMEIMNEIKAGKKYPFEKTTQLNIGNPQSVGQGVFTFNREVLAGLVHLPLLADGCNALSVDAKERAKLLSKKCTSPLGAYTGDSRGYQYVRECVSDFINKRDGLKGDDMSNYMQVHLTNGASEAVRLSLMGVIRNETDGVLVPIPQYPLYSAQLTLQKGLFLPYFLDESKNWGVDIDEIEA